MSQISLKSKFTFLLVATALLILPVASAAAATVVTAGTPNDVVALFTRACLSFYTNIESLCLKFMWGFFAVEVGWGATKNVLENNPIDKTLIMLMQAILRPGLCTLFIKKGSEWLPAVMKSLNLFGTTGTGYTGALNPLAVFDMGVALQNQMVAQFNAQAGTGAVAALTNFFPSLLMMFVCVVILISFTIIALSLFLYVVEAYILIAISPILFAMGANRWTKDLAIKPWNSQLAVGLKAVVALLVLSIAVQLAPLWAKMAASWSFTDWSPLYWTAFSAAGVAFLAFRIPKIAGDALSGTASMSAGEAIQVAAAAAIAAVGGAAVGAAVAEKAVGATMDAFSGGAPNLGSFGSGNSISDLTGNQSRMPGDLIPGVSGSSPSSDGSTVTVGNHPKGDATTASIGGAESDTNIKKMFDDFAKQNNNQLSKSDHVKGAIQTFSQAVPNDQATVGGDHIKSHSE